MQSRAKLAIVILGIALLTASNLTAVGAQGPPDMTKFGYPTVAKSMDLTPDQDATITAGERSVAIKAGTFDVPVTFDLLTADPSTWQDKVQGRTIHDAFAFRVTDKATKALIGTFKQPVVYSYTDSDVASTDAILNTTAATPPVITPNAAPITFATGKASHPFGGAGVGWLLVSAPTGGAANTTGGATAVATGTGGGTSATVPTTLPQTGVAHATGPNPLLFVAFGGGGLLLAGGLFTMRRPATSVRR
ncbi:MAG: hypothetical protein LC793_21730 [Thermomicrobia bacterium]|nr:hypothetical protein [Thermomicrobia bacterium]MCA1723428.1 hypothetical protein [Thermomicrobia bacterium]